MRPDSSADWLQGGAKAPNPLLDPHLVWVSTDLSTGGHLG